MSEGLTPKLVAVILSIAVLFGYGHSYGRVIHLEGKVVHSGEVIHLDGALLGGCPVLHLDQLDGKPLASVEVVEEERIEGRNLCRTALRDESNRAFAVDAGGARASGHRRTGNEFQVKVREGLVTASVQGFLSQTQAPGHIRRGIEVAHQITKGEHVVAGVLEPVPTLILRKHPVAALKARLRDAAQVGISKSMVGKIIAKAEQSTPASTVDSMDKVDKVDDGGQNLFENQESE